MTGESPSPRLFGTDGIRAPFGTHPLDRPTVTALGYHLGETLGKGWSEPWVLLGGDTRESTPEICSWLAAGLRAAGARVSYLGVLPTPAVAFLVRRRRAAAGVAVSASHNPYPDNGIKLIDHRGFKWSPTAEVELERRLESGRDLLPLPAGEELPLDREGAEEYLEGLRSILPGPRPLAGLRMAVDAAHGAASPYAGRLFQELGAAVTLVAASPDGRNINRGCGSTHPESLADLLSRREFDLGVAFDGDADRAIPVDERGEVRDGDAILYLWALDLLRSGDLQPPRVVATTMSNLGLERALAREGIEVVRCGVGDRVVVETMLKEGILLGGEQSGHIVNLRLSTTGDGLLTAIALAHLRVRTEKPLSALLNGFRRYPQVLRNVSVRRKVDFAALPRVRAVARQVEEALGGEGRLVLRYSGTEPLARIMIEGPEEERIRELAADLAQAIARELGDH